jgi:4-carboxymuconolactone decarboxylase
MEIVAIRYGAIETVATGGPAVERLAPLEPPWDEPVARDLAAMMPPGVPPLRLFRALAHNPRVLGKIRAGNLLDRGSLERIDRELAILRTCARCRSEYEWGVHVAVFARRYGLPEEKIAGTVAWGGRDLRWSQREGAIVRGVDELHDTAAVSPALWRELAGLFAPAQIVELLVLVGFYHTISFVTNGLALDLEASAERFPPAGP